MAGSDVLFVLLLLFFLISFIFTVSLPVPPILVLALLLAIEIFLKTIRWFRQAEDYRFTELNKYSIDKNNTL